MPMNLFSMLQDDAPPADDAAATPAPAADAPAPDAAAAAPAAAAGGSGVSFPDDYPNSVKHFLLLGAIGMFLGAICFLVLSNQRAKTTLSHACCFLLAASGAMSYYAMWSGLGVSYKELDTTPRVIFLGRYLGHLITMPLALYNLTLVLKADFPSTFALIGYDLMMVLAGAMGSSTVGSHKYIWWCVSLAFGALVVVDLAKRVSDAGSDTAKILTYITIFSTCFTPLIWLLGSEGTAALGLSQEVGLVTIVDLVSTVGFGLYLTLNYDAVFEDDDEKADSQQYV
ncbi:hypothetical protein T484DRAFT_1937304, partial [Baffinella frigidus]